ncbi:MAG TPA: hypothetical protein VK718_02005 [Ferruginibacter sp.]|jgi:hypothetical protein|nr:hypothetical protein [Ferruginibacter sp.]
MKKIILITGMMVATVIVFSTGCSKNNVESLTGEPSTFCDDTANTKYNEDIVPLMKLHCYYCHGDANTAGSGGISLATAAQLQKYAANNMLIGDLVHFPGYVPMPYGMPILSPCEINKFIDWVNRGAQDN